MAQGHWGKNPCKAKRSIVFFIIYKQRIKKTDLRDQGFEMECKIQSNLYRLRIKSVHKYDSYPKLQIIYAIHLEELTNLYLYVLS